MFYNIFRNCLLNLCYLCYLNVKQISHKIQFPLTFAFLWKVNNLKETRMYRQLFICRIFVFWFLFQSTTKIWKYYILNIFCMFKYIPQCEEQSSVFFWKMNWVCKNLSLIWIIYLFIYWMCHVVCRILVPQPGIKPAPLTVEAWGPNWIAKEFLE